MAEVVGLVASIIGIAGAGAKLALALYQFADAIGSAGHEARTIATEVSLFSQSLSAVSKSLDRKSSKDESLKDVAEAVTKACHSLIEDLRLFLKELLPTRKSTFDTYSKRVKWVLRKPKVRSLRSSIESVKSTLTLLVASVDTAEASRTHAPETIMYGAPMMCSLQS